MSRLCAHLFVDSKETNKSASKPGASVHKFSKNLGATSKF